MFNKLVQDSPRCILEEPQAQLGTNCRSDPTVALFLVEDQWDSRTTDDLKYTNFDFVKNISIFLICFGNLDV